MEFRILGPLEVRDGERDVTVGHGHERALLLQLLIHRNEPVSTDALASVLWRDEPPPSAGKMIQVYVARLRKRLDDGRIETVGGGYRVRVEDAELDAARFETLLEQATLALGEGDPASAAGTLDEALGLWRGEALAELSDDELAQPEIARLEELRVAALELRLQAKLELGANVEVVSETDALVRRHPYRETLRRQQAIALYRAGRPTEALDAVRRAYADLDELGLEPGPSLRDLEGAILRHDPSLEVGAGATPVSVMAEPVETRRSRLSARVAVIGAVAAAVAVAVLAVSVLDRGETDAALAAVPAGSVGVVDLDGRIVSAIPITGDPGPIAVSGRTAWVGTRSARTLTRIDTTEQRIVRVVGLPAAAYEVAASAVAAWTANGFEGTITRVLAEGDAVTGPIRVTPTSHGRLALAIADGALWVASQDDVVTRIDQATLQGVATVRGLENPYVLAAGEGGVWALQRGTSTVTKIDPGTNDVAGTITVPGVPTAIAVGEGAVWALGTAERRLWRLDPTTGKASTEIEIESEPLSVAAGAGSIWVATATGAIVRVDPETDSVASTTVVADAIAGLAVGDGHVWVSVPN